MPPKSRSPLRYLLIAIMVVAPLSFLLSLPWLKDQDDGLIFLLAGIASAATVLAAIGFAILQDRRLDEWHRQAAQFSSQWGWTVGASLVAMLLALPPLQGLLVSTLGHFAGVSDPSYKLVILAFTAGFVITVLTQAISTTIISIVWVGLKSRGPREE